MDRIEQPPLEQQVQQLQQEVEALRQRNTRVEADKSWETSFCRKATIAVITYATASAFLYLIGVRDFLLSALVPTFGFLLSTQSLPVIKQWWIERNLK
jgi:hypothetical protein